MHKKEFFSVGCLVVAIMMVMSSLMPLSMSAEPVDSSQVTGMQMVYNINPDVLTALEEDGFSAAETYDSFTMIELSDEKVKLLENYGYEVSDMADRTMISVPGYEFDTRNGAPSVPSDLKAKETAPGVKGLYIVQMPGPVKEEWFTALSQSGAEIIAYLSNFAYEVRMTPEVCQAVQDLDCVGWVGIYEPAYKISPNLNGSEVTISMVGDDIPSDSIDSVRSEITVRKEGVTSGGYIFHGTMKSDASLAAIAASPYVQFIEPYIEAKLSDEMGSQITGGYAWVNDPDSNLATPYRTLGNHGAYVNQLGWDGSGVTVAIVDTGLGDGTTPNAGHVDFTGRVIGSYDFGTIAGTADEHGHGTHCCGLMAGDAYEGTGRTYAGFGPYYTSMGMAHESQIFAVQVFEGAAGDNVFPTDYSLVLQQAYAGGADVQSNSWNAPTDSTYVASDQAYDAGVRDADPVAAGNQQAIIVFSAGNEGSALNTIGSPGNAKNVITVGSCRNYMPDASSYGYTSTNPTDPNIISTFSSRGWGEGGRVKPDVCAPGEGTLSTRSPSTLTNRLYGFYTPDTRYQWCTGTSQACPTVAGGTAAIYEWYMATYGSAPTPAITKAFIINSAVDIATADIPNQNEGWGRMYLPRVVDPAYKWVVKDSQPELTTGTYKEYIIQYVNSGLPMKVTLTYTDKNAPAGDTTPLINNLDLRLTSSTGTVYHGNAFSGGVTPGGTNPVATFDTNADGWDDVNNVECIYIPAGSLQTGWYTLRVTGFNVPGDCDNDGANDQDYSLVVYNALEPAAATATGPIGSSNNPAVTLTYSWIGLPTSVNLYYTKTGGTSWTLAGNDATVDGSYSYTITAGTGTYGWLASAVGGSSSELSPPTAGTAPEATPFIFDTTAPAAPTGLTVQHWGYGPAPAEIRYMRGDTHTVNTLTTYQLGTSQSAIQQGAVRTQTGGTGQAVVWGMRAWKRTSAGVETELTGGSMTATVTRTANAAGLQSNTWSCPGSLMATTDSIVVRVYDQIGTGAVTQRAEFTTVQLGTPQLVATTWTVYYYTVRTSGGAGMSAYTGSTFYWGTTTYNSRVENFSMWKNGMSTLYDNTLNWTHSGADVDHFNIYRSSTQAGTYSVIGTSPVGTNTYCDRNMGLADTTYWWYRVRAVDAATNEDTNTVSVQEPGGVTTPIATVTALTPVTPSSDSTPIITYTYANAPTSVEFYRATVATGPYTLIGSEAPDGSYQVLVAIPAGTYYFAARGITGEAVPTASEFGPYVIDTTAPTITATTFTDGASGVAITAGQYDVDFSENMAAIGSVTNNLPGASGSWVDANTYRITYNTLAYSTLYTMTYQTTFTDVAGNALGGDRVKEFTTMAAPATATATGPTSGGSNIANILITYSYANLPTSVNLYYTTNGGASWTLAGNDAGVDGSYAWTVPAFGTYGWLASAVGGGSTEPSPPAGGTAPESTSYIFDNVAPTISTTTFTDGATGVAITAGQYDVDFSENMAVAGSVTTNLVGASGSWVDANTYRITYTTLAYLTLYTQTYQTTFTDLAGNALGGDRIKEFTTQNAAATATATGPTGGPTNVADITITYTVTGTPTSVNVYYTSNGGATWTLAGNDPIVDGSFSFTLSASGNYQFLVSAVGGGSTEPSPPPGGTPPETVVPYILDIVPPAAPTDLTVEHWGPAGSGGTTTETLYMRGVVNEATVNGLTTYSLSSTQSANQQTYQIVAARQNVWAGIQVWSRDSLGIETEITSGVSAIAGPPGNNVQGMFAATWDCPGAMLSTTDSIVVRIYGGTANPPTDLAASFTTGALGATQLEAVQWTVNYYMGQLTGNSFVAWGDATYNTNIANFQYTASGGGDPTDHNTLNWTHDGTDVDHYNVYRADSEFGSYSVIDTVPVGTNTYTDLDKGQADNITWWYIVRAVDAVGNEEMNTVAIPEPSGPFPVAYSIDLTGKPAVGWVFVSFPVDISGNIQTILDDADTVWNVAKWYDPITKIWKTYRKTGTKTFTDIDNTMGVWLHLTANGGDQKLTTSVMGMMPTVDIVISLYSGWNMVSYPSMTDRLGSLTLPAEADLVSEWQLSSPYIVDKAKADVTMSHGNAYWVRVSADCTWTISP